MERERRKVNRDIKLNMIFWGILVVPSLIWGLICLIGLIFPGVIKAIDYDTGENRNPASFPSEISGDYFAKIENYYNDRVPFRSLIISGGRAADELFESAYRGGIKDSLVSFLYGETPASEETSMEKESEATTSGAEPEVEEKTSGSGGEAVSPATTVENIDIASYMPPDIRNNNVIIGRGDWLFLYSYSNINYYLGNNQLSEEELQSYAAAVNACNTACLSKGKKLAILLVPDKTQVYSEYMPSYELVDTYKRVQRLVDYLGKNTEAKVSYPLEELIAIKEYYRPYLKYDTHWSNVGAFIGCQVLNRMLGRETTNLLNLRVSSEPISGGDLIGFGNLSAADYTNDVKYNITVPNEAMATLVTGGVSSDTDVYHVELDIPEGESMVLIGDSFRNAMAQYVYHGFKASTIIHVNYLANSGGTLNGYITDSDVICIVLNERNDYRLLETLEYITNLLQ